MRGLGLPGMGLQLRGGGIPYLLPVAGAILHLRGDLGITTVGADVDIWRDQSGTGNHALPNALLFNRPEYQAAGGVSGTPGVSFQRGAVEGMDLSTMVNASNDYTVFAVVEQYNAHNGTQVLLSTGIPAPGGDPFDPAVLVQNTTTELGVTDNVGFISSDCPSMNDEQYLTWRLDSDSGTFDCYRNTLHLGTGAYDGTGRTFNTMTTLGCRVGGALYEADCVLSEIIVFPTALSAADRALVDAYIAARYAMVYTAIGSVEGGLAWFDAALGITSTGAGVSAWVNQTDTARNQVYAAAVDATQGTDADRPLWGAATGVNSLPGVTFDAANTEFMDLGAMTDASNDYTVFAILNQTATANTQTLLGSAAAATVNASHTATLSINDGTAWRDAVAAMTGDQAITWVLDSTGTAVNVYRDFTLLGTDTYDATWAWLNPELGKTPAGTDHLNATLSELVVFNRNLNDLELAAVHAELLAKFALAFDAKTSIEGNILWLDAALGVTESGDVTAWLDQGPAGNDANNAGGGNEPLYEATGWSTGLPQVTFDSANSEWLDLAAMTDASHDYTLVTALDGTALGGTQPVLGSSAARMWYLDRTGGGQVGYFDGANRNVAAGATGEQLLTWVLDSAAPDGEVWRNSVSLGTAVYGTTWAWAAPNLGAIGGGAPASFMDAAIARLALYNRILTDEERAAVEAQIIVGTGL